MNKTITCKQCASSFQATDEQQAFILASRRKGMRFIMLRCANCAHYTDFDPFEGGADGVGESISWRTPVSKINGYVSLVEDGANRFYGCGESGFIRRTREKFYQSIEAIIERYPHRKYCYQKVGGDWFPAEREPSNMDDLIDTEEENDYDEFEIG